MVFGINKRRNILLLLNHILPIVMLLIFAFSFPFSPKSPIDHGIKVGALAGCGYALYCCVFTIWDFRTTLYIDEEGLHIHRHGEKNRIPWKSIRRLEYRGNKRIPVFNMLMIHTSSAVLRVEYTFENYRLIWRILRDGLLIHNPEAIIDSDIPFEE